MMKTQKSDTQKNNLIEESKRKDIDEIIRQKCISINNDILVNKIQKA